MSVCVHYFRFVVRLKLDITQGVFPPCVWGEGGGLEEILIMDGLAWWHVLYYILSKYVRYIDR